MDGKERGDEEMRRDFGMKGVRGGVCCCADAAVFTRFGQTFGVRGRNIGQRTSGASSFASWCASLPQRAASATNPPPTPLVRLISGEKRQLHSSPSREVGHMAEWRAELRNYHIKPAFSQTLGVS